LHLRKRALELARAVNEHRLQPQPEASCGVLEILDIGSREWVRTSAEHGDALEAGDHVDQKLQAFGPQLRLHGRQPRHITAGLGKTLDQTRLDRSPGRRHHDRYGARDAHRGLDRRRMVRGDHVDLELHELSGYLDGARVQRVGVPPLDRDVLALHIAELTHARPEGLGERMRR